MLLLWMETDDEDDDDDLCVFLHGLLSTDREHAYNSKPYSHSIEAAAR